MRYNYPLAFVEYCKGSTVEDIATLVGIPEDTLRRKIVDEHWATLKRDLPVALPAAEDSNNRVAKVAQLMQENREENYRLWCSLRSDAAKLIEDLVEDRLRFKRFFHNKGAVIEHTHTPTMADRNAMAQYLQIIANGSYLALGDRGAAEGRSGADTGGNAVQAPAITIFLPGAVSLPREQRSTVEVTSTLKVEKPSAPKGPIVDAEVVG